MGATNSTLGDVFGLSSPGGADTNDVTTSQLAAESPSLVLEALGERCSLGASCCGSPSEIARRQRLVEARRQQHAIAWLAKYGEHSERRKPNALAEPKLDSAPYAANLCQSRCAQAFSRKVPSAEDQDAEPLSQSPMRGRAGLALERPSNDGKKAAHDKEELLARALLHGDVAAVSNALRHGDAALVRPNPRGTTPLMMACTSDAPNAPDVIRALLSNRADHHATDYQGWNCLHHAARNGRADVVRCLLSEKVEPSVRTDGQRIPCAIAAEGGHAKVLEVLLGALEEHGGVAGTDSTGSSALHAACKVGSAECVRLLLRHGAKINTVDKLSRSPLMFAAASGRLKCVKILVESHAQVHTTDSKKDTCLHYACFKRLDEIALHLFRQDADVNAENIDGDTPLAVGQAMQMYNFVKEARLQSLGAGGEELENFDAEHDGESAPSRRVADARKRAVSRKSESPSRKSKAPSRASGH